jgi:hypothetical protein
MGDQLLRLGDQHDEEPPPLGTAQSQSLTNTSHLKRPQDADLDHGFSVPANSPGRKPTWVRPLAEGLGLVGAAFWFSRPTGPRGSWA